MTPEAYLDALLSLPGIYAPSISRDGRWLAWTWFRAGPTADIYAAPTDGSVPPVRLTDSDQNTFLLGWTPDSRAVLAAQDKDGNERARVYRVAIDEPLKMQPLTEDDPNYFLRGGELHPNGRYLVYGANLDVDSGAEIEQTWVYRHDLETGERLPLAKPEKAGYIRPRLSPTGEHISYNRKDLHPSGMQVWLVGVDGENDHEIINAGDDRKVFASWFPDGERMVVLAETETHMRLGVYDLDSGEIRWLIDDPARNIESAYVPHRSAQIVVIEVRDASTVSYLLDPASAEETHLPQIAGNLQLLAPLDSGNWAGYYYSSTQPGDVVRFPLDNPDPATFTSLTRIWERTDLSPDDLYPAEDFRWISSDDLDIQGWLYRTPGEAKGTIVYVHGGPTSHSRDFINTQIQFFVRSGFNVLDPNYRGSTGFSLAFREAIKKDGWGGLEQEDIATGIRALIAAGIAQAGAVGITGTSYGGYSSWCAITRYPADVIAASAPICGMTDLVVDYETTRPDLRPYSEEMMGGRPDEVPERYHERSPIHFVERIKGQLLIVQGMRDPNVSPENVREVTEALQKAGIEFGLLPFDDEGHGISKPKNQKTLYIKLSDFFENAFTG